MSTKRLTKAQRAQVRSMFGGRCAYCGCELGDRWHADHVEPVGREWWKKDGSLERPEHDHIGNLMPACAPCNIDKHAMTLDHWRAKLQRSCEVLANNHTTYRHALRFGLLRETQATVSFYFERIRAEQPTAA